MPAPFRALSFDCFGTLIDWRFGQGRVLRQLPSLRGHEHAIDAIAHAREAIERELETGPWISYAEVLARSVRLAALKVASVELSERESQAFAAGQLGWPAFSDSAAALARLAEHYPIALLSNCDDEVLELATRKHLGIPVNWFVSAESVRSYKPAPPHWQRLLDLSGLQAHEVLHVSFAREYDLEVAQELGFALGFVSRYGIEAPSDLNLSHQAGSLGEFAETVLA
jgi:2-haloalkanoic acid dehalogenase type II